MMEAKKHSPFSKPLTVEHNARSYISGIEWYDEAAGITNRDHAEYLVYAANNIERVEQERDALLEALREVSKLGLALPNGLYERIANALGHEYGTIGEINEGCNTK